MEMVHLEFDWFGGEYIVHEVKTVYFMPISKEVSII